MAASMVRTSPRRMLPVITRSPGVTSQIGRDDRHAGLEKDAAARGSGDEWDDCASKSARSAGLKPSGASLAKVNRTPLSTSSGGSPGKKKGTAAMT